jgi:hypothetical protein
LFCDRTPPELSPGEFSGTDAAAGSAELGATSGADGGGLPAVTVTAALERTGPGGTVILQRPKQPGWRIPTLQNKLAISSVCPLIAKLH